MMARRYLHQDTALQCAGEDELVECVRADLSLDAAGIRSASSRHAA
jgi:hypothetical protein